MIRESVLANIVERQRERVQQRDPGLSRVARLSKVPPGFVSIITGVRRCGKSTLMEQCMRTRLSKAFYLNLESAALAGLELGDAAQLDRAIERCGATALYFDEVQQLKGWEHYVRTKLDEGFEVFVTGSNASVLGQELGTKLTGRHIDCELFPFDYAEYLAFMKVPAGEAATRDYLVRGGFPAYLASQDERLLETLFEDILIRDVAVRYAIREVDALRRLASYLIDNIAGRVSATRLRQPLAIASSSTILKWCEAFSNAYLFDFIPCYSPSVKVQLVNPRKVYCIDTGLQHILTATPAPDDARAFENLVYLALRRHCRTVFYYTEGQRGECDFIPLRGKRLGAPVQATVTLNGDSEAREINGLRLAMRALKQPVGWIVTLADEDVLRVEEGVIRVVPFHRFAPQLVLPTL